MEEDFVSLQIPKDIYEKLSQRIDGTEFKSVQEYVTFVLKEVVSEEEEEEEIYNEADEEEIKERLKGLGYL